MPLPFHITTQEAFSLNNPLCSYAHNCTLNYHQYNEWSTLASRKVFLGSFMVYGNFDTIIIYLNKLFVYTCHDTAQTSATTTSCQEARLIYNQSHNKKHKRFTNIWMQLSMQLCLRLHYHQKKITYLSISQSIQY